MRGPWSIRTLNGLQIAIAKTGCRKLLSKGSFVNDGQRLNKSLMERRPAVSRGRFAGISQPGDYSTRADNRITCLGDC